MGTMSGVLRDGSVQCWGDDDFGKATPPEGEFASVSAGGAHTCGVRTDGSVVCWGYDGRRRGHAAPGEVALRQRCSIRWLVF